MASLTRSILSGGLGAVLMAIATLATPSHASDTVRPRTGGQLYTQRVVALQDGQWYNRIPPSAFVEQWQTASQQPTYEQWQALLAQEADRMAAWQGNYRLTVLVGDSLYLWIPPELLSPDRLWLNQSISGETTAHMVRRLSYFAKVQPTDIFVMAGVNDLKNGLDPMVVVSNLELIVQRLRRQHPQARLVVVSMLPTRLAEIPSQRVQAVNQQMAIAAQQRGAIFANVQPAFMDSQGLLRVDLTTDGLHLNAQGYRLLADYLNGL